MRLNPDVPRELERIIDKCSKRIAIFATSTPVRDPHRSATAEARSGPAHEDAATEGRPVDARSRTCGVAVLSSPRPPSLPERLPVSMHSRRPSPLTDKDTIVLADFTNTTGDSVFDDTLRQGLAVQLAAVPVPQPDFRRSAFTRRWD